MSVFHQNRKKAVLVSAALTASLVLSGTSYAFAADAGNTVQVSQMSQESLAQMNAAYAEIVSEYNEFFDSGFTTRGSYVREKDVHPDMVSQLRHGVVLIPGEEYPVLVIDSGYTLLDVYRWDGEQAIREYEPDVIYRQATNLCQDGLYHDAFGAGSTGASWFYRVDAGNVDIVSTVVYETVYQESLGYSVTTYYAFDGPEPQGFPEHKEDYAANIVSEEEANHKLRDEHPELYIEYHVGEYVPFGDANESTVNAQTQELSEEERILLQTAALSFIYDEYDVEAEYWEPTIQDGTTGNVENTYLFWYSLCLASGFYGERPELGLQYESYDGNLRLSVPKSLYRQLAYIMFPDYIGIDPEMRDMEYANSAFAVLDGDTYHMLGGDVGEFPVTKVAEYVNADQSLDLYYTQDLYDYAENYRIHFEYAPVTDENGQTICHYRASSFTNLGNAPIPDGPSNATASENNPVSSEEEDHDAEYASATAPVTGYRSWEEAGLTDHEIEWNDAALEQRFRKATGITDRKLTLRDVWDITEIALNPGEGEEKITDISALSELQNLQKINLNYNAVTDIHALGELGNLDWLTLNSNQITDIGPLTRLSQLACIDISNNPIENLMAIGTVTSLQRVTVFNTGLTNESFALLAAQLQNFSGLYKLDIGGNTITDFSPLMYLTGLTEVDIWNGNLTDDSLANLINALVQLPNIQTIHLSHNSISNAAAFVQLPNLVDLVLRDNVIRDVSALGNLTRLTKLDLRENPIADYSVTDAMGIQDYQRDAEPVALEEGNTTDEMSDQNTPSTPSTPSTGGAYMNASDCAEMDQWYAQIVTNYQEAEDEIYSYVHPFVNPKLVDHEMSFALVDVPVLGAPVLVIRMGTRIVDLYFWDGEKAQRLYPNMDYQSIELFLSQDGSVIWTQDLDGLIAYYLLYLENGCWVYQNGEENPDAPLYTTIVRSEEEAEWIFDEHPLISDELFGTVTSYKELKEGYNVRNGINANVEIQLGDTLEVDPTGISPVNFGAQKQADFFGPDTMDNWYDHIVDEYHASRDELLAKDSNANGNIFLLYDDLNYQYPLLAFKPAYTIQDIFYWDGAKANRIEEGEEYDRLVTAMENEMFADGTYRQIKDQYDLAHGVVTQESLDERNTSIPECFVNYGIDLTSLPSLDTVYSWCDTEPKRLVDYMFDLEQTYGMEAIAAFGAYLQGEALAETDDPFTTLLNLTTRVNACFDVPQYDAATQQVWSQMIQVANLVPNAGGEPTYFQEDTLEDYTPLGSVTNNYVSANSQLAATKTADPTSSDVESAAEEIESSVELVP